MKTFPLINGPVGGLCYQAQTPARSLRCVQTFRDCAVTDFYEFDAKRQRYVWSANEFPLACVVSIRPMRANA